MKALVLVLNSGSSSIKFQLFAPLMAQQLLSGMIENIGASQSNLRYEISGKKTEESMSGVNYSQALARIVILINQAILQQQDCKLVAIGHRVVHGGNLFTEPTLINEKVIKQIQACIALAPLHNPANLAGIEAAQQEFPGIPQVAVFDTAFHQTMPDYAYLYALPYSYSQDYGVRRYGFHGISYQYLTQATAQLFNKSVDQVNLICAHLGNGSSVCAIAAGKSVDTSMGLTPLEGLIMGTRSGDIDPGLFNYLTQKLQISVAEMTSILNKSSGLLGISQLTQDMRELQQAAEAGNTFAVLAIEMYCYRLAKYIASFLVTVEKLDALVFSGGIGENSRLVREKTLQWLKPLGFELDFAHNAANGVNNNHCIASATSLPVLVIPTQEELMIAQAAIQFVKE